MPITIKEILEMPRYRVLRELRPHVSKGWLPSLSRYATESLRRMLAFYKSAEIAGLD